MSNSPSFCGNCGNPMQGNSRFCGNCGKAVSGGDAAASSAGSQISPMVFVGAAMIVLAVVAVVGVVFFGDRLGLANNQTQVSSEPTPIIEPTTENESDVPEDQGETAGDEPEAAESPESPVPDNPAFTEPDAAFDGITPTLTQMTDAPILLPGSLPEEFAGVSIDDGTTTDSYDINFYAEEQSEVVQTFVNAYVGAVISAEPGEVAPVEYGPGVTTTRLDDVNLPDGTTAVVEYHEAPEAANTNIFATGRFVRDDENGDSYTYLVTVEFDSPEAAWTKELLTSMVPVEDPVTGTAEPDEPEGETFEQEFVTRYYDAVAARDWYTTYSLLDSSSQAEFTEAEWVEAQEARVAATNPPPLESATVQSVTGEAAGFVADIYLTYTDGTTETVPIQAVLEEDGLKRYLTAEDVSYLRGLAGDTGETDSGAAASVEEFVYGYYDAVAAEDWSATYAMLDYGGQAAFTESEWIERQEARQAASGAPSPVVDVSVDSPDSYPPVSTATVTFADGDVVEILVADPHSEDGQYDRVLTAEEISFLQGL